MRLVERCLRLRTEPTVNMDRIVGETLVPLLFSQENRAWISEIRDEVEKQWASAHDRSDPYHKPSYKLKQNNS